MCIPSSRLDETLLIATRNIREFGRRKRLALSLHYIAEVIGQFDVVVLVELRDNVEELATVQRYLGPYWDVLYSDDILDAGGNRERIALLYDTRAACFTGFASHVFSPRTKNACGQDERVPRCSRATMASPKSIRLRPDQTLPHGLVRSSTYKCVCTNLAVVSVRNAYILRATPPDTKRSSFVRRASPSAPCARR